MGQLEHPILRSINPLSQNSATASSDNGRFLGVNFTKNPISPTYRPTKHATPPFEKPLAVAFSNNGPLAIRPVPVLMI